MPLEVIAEKRIPVQSLKADQSIVSHDGIDYSLSPEDMGDTSFTVFIPNKTGNKYEKCKRIIPAQFCLASF
jgi:hypothetical protein